MGKSCPWIEDYPILRPNFYRVFIWTRVVSVSRMTFVSLQARAKVFTREKVISPPPGVTLSRKRGDPTPRMTLPPGWPYPQGDLTPRVTLPPGWPYPKGDLTPRVTLPQGWPYPLIYMYSKNNGSSNETNAGQWWNRCLQERYYDTMGLIKYTFTTSTNSFSLDLWIAGHWFIPHLWMLNYVQTKVRWCFLLSSFP